VLETGVQVKFELNLKEIFDQIQSNLPQRLI
jgi:hypothetical protein